MLIIRSAGYLALALVALAVLAAVATVLHPRPRPMRTDPVRMPALAMEFVDSPGALYRILGAPDDTSNVAREFRKQLRAGIKFDYVFIAAYWTLFVLISLVLARRGGGWPVWVAAAAVLAITAAAGFDVVENVRMARVIHTLRLAGNDVATAGTMKWLFSFTALALLSTTFFGRGGWVWVVGAACLLIAGLGLAGLGAIRAGSRQLWPIELAFGMMMFVLLPLVAAAFTVGRGAFTSGPG